VLSGSEDLLDNGMGELFGGVGAVHVGASNVCVLVNIVHGTLDQISVLLHVKMTKHHARSKDKSGRVGAVRASNVETDVTSSRLEDGNARTKVGT
jgi:hypothetical protein